MTPMALDEALNVLLGDERTGDPLTDLATAARESMRRREINSAAGSAVLYAMVTQHHRSYAQITDLTGIPEDIAQKWAAPPERKPLALAASRLFSHA